MTRSSESGAHLLGELIAPGPRSCGAEVRLEAIERKLRNEVNRLRDEEVIRLALHAAYIAARATGLTDKEVFARLHGVDPSTWWSWMHPRLPVSPGSKPKRIPGWPVKAMLRVCPEARDALLGSLCDPVRALRAG